MGGRMLRTAAPFGAAVAMATVAMMAFAEDSAGAVIHGCVATVTGSLRVIDATATCRPGERRISWNDVGPPGPVGATGPQGPAGLGGLVDYQFARDFVQTPVTRERTFLGPTVTLDFEEGQVLHLEAGGEFGSYDPAGANGLSLDICSRSPDGSLGLVADNGPHGLAVPGGTVVPFSFAKTVALRSMFHEFGICGLLEGNLDNWNADNRTWISVLVFDR
jgi:hypothetical protein